MLVLTGLQLLEIAVACCVNLSTNNVRHIAVLKTLYINTYNILSDCK